LNSEHTISKHRFVRIPVITSDRLILKEIGRHNAVSIVDISVYNGVFATNVAEAIYILEQINSDVANGESLHWGIFLKDSDEIAGTCGYYRGFIQNSGEIGYILRPSYRGLGIMTEAVKLIVAFGFDTLKLHTVVAYTSPANSESIAVLQRAGFNKVKSEHADLKFEQLCS
jgi:ribosomal-protein-alanine N-acetyltransferase